MPFNNISELPHSFDCIDPSLVATPGTPFHNDCKRGVQLLLKSPTSFPFDADLGYGLHATPFKTVNRATSSCPALPTSAFPYPEPLFQHSSSGVDTLDSFSYIPFSSSYEPIAVQSACPSPILPAFDLVPQQVRATSQPPENLIFQDLGENSTIKSAQSMSFHRIVQPRGKRAHTYHPYSRRHGSGTKRERAANSHAPTSAPKTVSLSHNTVPESANANDSSSQDLSHAIGFAEREHIEQVKSVQDRQREPPQTSGALSPVHVCKPQTSSPHVGISSSSNSECPTNFDEKNTAIIKETLLDLKQDDVQQLMMQMPLSLGVASYIQSLAQLCSAVHSSLREALAINNNGGNIGEKLKLER